MRTLIPGSDDLGRRLDRVMRRLLPAVPLSGLFRAIRTGEILVGGQGPGGRLVDGKYRLRRGDTILVGPRLAESLPSARAGDVAAEQTDAGVRAGAARRSAKDLASGEAPEAGGDRSWLRPAIILETEDLLVLNKPRGLVVHGKDSVEEVVRAYLAPRIPPSLSFLPGPLHRLDRNTTGLLVFGKSLAGARLFTGRLRSGGVAKRYLALLEGRLTEEVRWADRLSRDRGARITREAGEGRIARTHARPLVHTDRYTLAAVSIETGLTHQIRAQAALHGHPLAGDRKYGAAPFPGGYLLHAWILELEGEGGTHGVGRLLAPPPAATVATLGELFGRASIDRLLATA